MPGGLFIVDDEATDTHEWTVEAHGDDEILIGGIDIHNTYTHPTLGICVGESTVTGEVTATLLGDPTDTSTITVEGGLSVDEDLDVDVHGHLRSENTNQETTSIGIHTTE